MSINHKINFALLHTGTELVTPSGIGRFRMYKEGNFKNQNVLVEDANGRLKWYAKHTLRLAHSIRKSNQILSKTYALPVPELLYYAI